MKEKDLLIKKIGLIKNFLLLEVRFQYTDNN